MKRGNKTVVKNGMERNGTKHTHMLAKGQATADAAGRCKIERCSAISSRFQKNRRHPELVLLHFMFHVLGRILFFSTFLFSFVSISTRVDTGSSASYNETLSTELRGNVLRESSNECSEQNVGGVPRVSTSIASAVESSKAFRTKKRRCKTICV